MKVIGPFALVLLFAVTIGLGYIATATLTADPYSEMEP